MSIQSHTVLDSFSDLEEKAPPTPHHETLIAMELLDDRLSLLKS